MKPGESLRIARKASGLTQEQLAQKIGVSKQALSAVETGVENSKSILEKAERVLGLDPGELGRNQRRGPVLPKFELPKTIFGLNKMTPGEWLRVARQEAGLSQVELADLIGCERGSIHSIETNQATSARILEQAEKVLDLEPGELGRSPRKRGRPRKTNS